MSATKIVINGQEVSLGGGGASTASHVCYDNQTSGLSAENVQDAIDELAQSVGGITPSPKPTGNVFGVMWDSSNPNTALTRLTKENDPNGYANTQITEEPVAGVGGTMGSSPFDLYLPWNGMEEYNIVNNEVSYKRGQDGFSRTENDTVVRIPEFYYYIIQSGTKWYWYISDSQKDGFLKHPGSGRYVGKYNTSGTSITAGYMSVSGREALTKITRENAREGSHAKGNNWWQYDYATWCSIWLLYLVEFSDWDIQKKIGVGLANGTRVYNNSGLTDAMIYHTGRSSGEDGNTAVQYRGIENPWGNVYDLVDGINFYNQEAFISLNNDIFQDSDITVNYKSAGVILKQLPGLSYISNIGYSSLFPWSFLPTESGGSQTEYIPDTANVSTTGGPYGLCVGGSKANRNDAGLFNFYAVLSATNSYDTTGSRLIYIPQEAVT